MASYRLDPLKFFAGYEHIRYANPTTPLGAGFNDIGGYVLAFVTNNAYNTNKTVQVYWSGARYTVIPRLDLTVAYYGYHQNAYGSGKTGGLHDVRTAFAAAASRPFPSTPTTDSTCIWTLTWAPCIAAYTTAWPAATFNDEHQSHRWRPLQVLSATRIFEWDAE